MRFCPKCRTQLWAVGDALAGYFRCDCGWVSEDWPKDENGTVLTYRGRYGMNLYFTLEVNLPDPRNGRL